MECRSYVGRICIECGTELAPGQPICPRCGTRCDEPPIGRTTASKTKGPWDWLDKPVALILMCLLAAVSVIGAGVALWPNDNVRKFVMPAGGGISNVVPLIALGFLIWGLCLSMICAARQFSITSRLDELRRRLSQHSANAQLVEAHAEECRATLDVRTSIGAIVDAWKFGAGQDATRTVAERQVEMQSERGETINSVIRFLIWAAPMLGLIGTVIGITMAVDQFAHFLGGNVDDIREIQSKLVTVTQGLAFAFKATVIGLCVALILMICSLLSNYAQRRLLFELDALLTEDVLFYLSRNHPAIPTPIQVPSTTPAVQPLSLPVNPTAPVAPSC